jgi:hypothetical protein
MKRVPEENMMRPETIGALKNYENENVGAAKWAVVDILRSLKKSDDLKVAKAECLAKAKTDAYRYAVETAIEYAMDIEIDSIRRPPSLVRVKTPVVPVVEVPVVIEENPCNTCPKEAACIRLGEGCMITRRNRY